MKKNFTNYNLEIKEYKNKYRQAVEKIFIFRKSKL